MPLPHHMVTVCCLSMLISSLISPLTVSAQSEITPPQVFAAVVELRNELELVRVAMQAPRETRTEIAVHGAQPREVYFQAVALVLKSSRLCTQSFMPDFGPPAVAEINPPRDLAPKHVWNQVQRAIGQIRCVKDNLQLADRAEPAIDDVRKTPNDVFKAIVQANRQMNLLLSIQFAPREVFALAHLANEHTAALLDELAPIWRVDAPALPDYVENKRPADVYERLIRCYTLIEQIARESGLMVLKIDETANPDLVPSDVFDMASLVLSEIRYFTTLVGMDIKFALFIPEQKVPSDVYQSVGQLETRLRVLARLVDIYPSWHTLRNSG